MKIIISERQKKIIDEVRVGQGKFSVEPINDFFSQTAPLKDFSVKILVKLTKKFLEKNTVIDVSNISDEKILKYILDLSYGTNTSSDFPKPMRSKDIAPLLAYYLSKKLFKLKDGYGLKYFVNVDDQITTYWFFDAEIVQLVGYMKLEPFEDHMKVDFVAVDKAFQGRGYGTKMYLTVINDVDVLYSDKILYKDALNLWVNILPKYVNVWAKIDGKNREFVKINRKTFVDPDNVVSFFAKK